MAWDLNNVQLIGRLVRDPELLYTKLNQAICKFSIANNRGSNQNGDEVNFFNITTWDKIANSCAQYLKKGSQVCISGKLRQDRWKNEAGENRSKVEITASSVQFIGGGGGQNTQGQTGPQNNNTTQHQEPEPSGTIPDDEVPF